MLYQLYFTCFLTLQTCDKVTRIRILMTLEHVSLCAKDAYSCVLRIRILVCLQAYYSNNCKQFTYIKSSF